MNQKNLNHFKEYLVELRKKSKFESDNFYPGPASEATTVILNDTLNKSIDNLIIMLDKDPTEKSIRDQIAKSLKLYDKSELDTEDREKVCQYYYEIAKAGEIAGVSRILNVWLYGFLGNFK